MKNYYTASACFNKETRHTKRNTLWHST